LFLLGFFKKFWRTVSALNLSECLAISRPTGYRQPKFVQHDVQQNDLAQEGDKMADDLSAMTFGEAFAAARRQGLTSIDWRGTNYRIDLVCDVASGFRRQVAIDRERGDLSDALAYGMGITRTRIAPQAFMGVDLAKPEVTTARQAMQIMEDERWRKFMERANFGPLAGSQWSKAEMESMAAQAAAEDPDFADIESAPVGRMVSEKPISSLVIQRHTNGGWLVEVRDSLTQGYDRIVRPVTTGAFTSTADMLRALADLLEQDDKKREDKDNG
jgi:hypothetical protein